MKTGEQILNEYNAQPSDLETFLTLEAMIDKYLCAMIERITSIEQFMKKNNVRLSDGARWMVWDNGEWVVREQKYGTRVMVILRTEHLDYALEVMADEEEII